MVVFTLGLIGSAFGAQPLPGGKANWSVVLGRFNAGDTNTWNRITTWTFNGSAGSVAATAWSWSSGNKQWGQVLNSHTCTFEGVTKTCASYTAYGWLVPSGQYVNWQGTYTYNTSTGQLDISWSTIGGQSTSAVDAWNITNPQTGIARATFISSNYNVTHGHGYGSNASWSTYKTMGQVPLVDYLSTTGRAAVCSYDGSTVTVNPTTPGAWKSAGWGMSAFTYPSSPNPKNCLHAKLATSACSTSIPPCASTKTGIIYHLSSNNNSRQMGYANFCACLTTSATFPCYSGNMHPQAMMQIIDDSGAMVGAIGIEAQNPPSGSGYPRYQFTLWDFTNIPW